MSYRNPALLLLSDNLVTDHSEIVCPGHHVDQYSGLGPTLRCSPWGFCSCSETAQWYCSMGSKPGNGMCAMKPETQESCNMQRHSTTLRTGEAEVRPSVSIVQRGVVCIYGPQLSMTCSARFLRHDSGCIFQAHQEIQSL